MIKNKRRIATIIIFVVIILIMIPYITGFILKKTVSRHIQNLNQTILKNNPAVISQYNNNWLKSNYIIELHSSNTDKKYTAKVTINNLPCGRIAPKNSTPQRVFGSFPIKANIINQGNNTFLVGALNFSGDAQLYVSRQNYVAKMKNIKLQYESYTDTVVVKKSGEFISQNYNIKNFQLISSHATIDIPSLEGTISLQYHANTSQLGNASIEIPSITITDKKNNDPKNDKKLVINAVKFTIDRQLKNDYLTIHIDGNHGLVFLNGTKFITRSLLDVNLNQAQKNNILLSQLLIQLNALKLKNDKDKTQQAKSLMNEMTQTFLGSSLDINQFTIITPSGTITCQGHIDLPKQINNKTMSEKELNDLFMNKSQANLIIEIDKRLLKTLFFISKTSPNYDIFEKEMINAKWLIEQEESYQMDVDYAQGKLYINKISLEKALKKLSSEDQKLKKSGEYPDTIYLAPTK